MQRRLVVAISIAYFAAFLGVGIVIASLGPIMLALSAQTGAEVDELAFLFTSRAVGYLLGSIVGGALVDKIPGHRVMFAGLIANSVATAMFPLLKSIPLLALLSSVQGLTMGFLDTGTASARGLSSRCRPRSLLTATNVLLLWLHGDKSGPWMQAMHCCFGIGALVSPLFVRASQSLTSSYHTAFWTFSLILCVSAVSFLFLPSPSPPQGSLQENAGGSSGFISTLRRMPRAALSLLFLVALLLGVYVGSEVSYGAYVLVYSHQRLGLDEVCFLFFGHLDTRPHTCFDFRVLGSI
jgi:FHS family Na+ dependent glucose MFS transporter 1